MAPRSLISIGSAALLAGCGSASILLGPSADTAPPPGLSTDSAPGDSAPGDSASGDSGAPTGSGGDSGDPGDSGLTEPSSAPISAVSWSVNPRVATLIDVQFTLDREAAEVWVAWTTDGEAWSTSPARALEPGEHSEVLLGVPSETPLTLSVHATVDGVDTATEPLDAATGPLPPDLVEPTLLAWDELNASPEGFLLTSVEVGRTNFFGPYYPVILNRRGQIVWYRSYDDDRLTMFPRVSPDGGHVLVDTTTLYSGGTPELQELTLDRSQERSTALSGWSLAYDMLPDGSILYDESTSSSQVYLSVHRTDGTTERLWDCKDWMSAIKDVGYWDCLPNTVLWYEDSNTVLWSMFQTSTIAEVSLDSGQVVRQLGALDGSWAFDPPDAGMSLQHFPNYTDAGTLILSTHNATPGPDGRSQHVREYRLDDADETLTQIWTYQNDLGYYADYAGEAKRLSSGNTLMGLGTDGAILEVSPDGELVWGVEWPNKLLGQATPLDDLYALNQGW